MLTCLAHSDSVGPIDSPTVITLIISILQILNSFNLLHGVILKWFMMLPLADIDLAWLVSFMLFAIIGFIIDVVIRRPKQATT
ncbi:branched-chain amino acid transport system II carrier protein [Staphylococcus aureus]